MKNAVSGYPAGYFAIHTGRWLEEPLKTSEKLWKNTEPLQIQLTIDLLTSQQF